MSEGSSGRPNDTLVTDMGDHNGHRSHVHGNVSIGETKAWHIPSRCGRYGVSGVSPCQPHRGDVCIRNDGTHRSSDLVGKVKMKIEQKSGTYFSQLAL